MIIYKTGDILKEPAEALVNPVNCVGVMGAGLALKFKKAYPANFSEYVAACKDGLVRPGRIFVHNTGRLVAPQYIVNFPTKRHWRENSRTEDVENGMDDLVDVIRNREIASIAIPPLGCGLGGLAWPEIKIMIADKLEGLAETRIIVFEPY